jgi:4-amino-4-deoxy-L-arabinose transferase-like glycosyltransferase
MTSIAHSLRGRGNRIATALPALNERAAPRIIGVLIVLNALLTAWIAATHLEPFADLATYYEAAQNIAQGKGYSLDIKIVANAARTDAPFPVGDRFLYPLLVAAAIRMFGDSLAVANVVSAISMSLVAAPLFFLGRALFDWRAGLVAVGLYTLSPFYHAIGIGGWTDLTATLFYYACLACAAQCVRQDRDTRIACHPSIWPLLTGLFFALAVLTREDAVVLALALGFVWWMRWRSLRDALALLAFPACAFLLRAAYLWQNFGSPFYNERSYFLLPRWALWYYLGSFSPGDYLDYVGGFGGAIAIRLYNYVRFVENLFSDGILYFTQTGLMPLVMLLPLAAAYVPHVRDGRFRLLARGPKPLASRLGGTVQQQRAGLEASYLLLCFSGVAALQLLLGIGYPGYAGNSTEVRHGQLIAPFLLLLTAGGLVSLWDGAPSRRALTLALSGVYLAFSVAYLGAWGFMLSGPPYRGPVVLAAEWARDHLPAGAVLMTRRAAETHYFSGKTVVVTPSAPFSEMMAYARAHHITHFLITDDERTGTPNLLQGMKAFAQNFRTVYSTDGAQIIAIGGYDFPASLSLPDELYAGKTVGRPSQLFNWNSLLPSGAGTIVDGFGQWGALFNALSHPAAVDRPLARDVNLHAGDAIELVRYALVSGSVSRGDDIRMTAHWRALAQPKSNYTVFVHLLDATGTLRAQKDSPPLNNARPTSVWDAGEWLEDRYTVAVPDDARPGQYMLEIGLYDSATGTRLPLRDSAGNRLADDRLLIEGLSVR